MMRAVNELSRMELMYILTNVLDIGYCEPCIECAACGDTPDAKYYVICDDCERSNREEEPTGTTGCIHEKSGYCQFVSGDCDAKLHLEDGTCACESAL